MTPHLFYQLRVTAIAALLFGTAGTALHAQFDGGRRDRGGFGGGPGGGPGGGFDFGGGRGGPSGFDPRGGITGILRSDEAQQELGISEEQRTALEELNNDSSSRDAMREVFDRSRRAETDEERQAIQAEMQKMFADMQAQREAKVKEILNEQQFTRANQLSLQRSGTSALARDDVAESLGLDAAQREQLTAISDEYRAAREELGFRASDEDRQKLREEFDAKYLGVLNDSQKSAWTAQLGAPATFDVTGRGGPPGGDRGSPSQSPAPAIAAVPQPQPQIIMAPPEGAVVVSSFGAPAGAATERGAEESNISFNFRYAPWVDVLKLFADRAGFTLDLNVVPPGTFNYYDDGAYTVTQALDILNGYLLPKGYVLVRRDRFLVCINVDKVESIPPNLVPTIERDELYSRGLNELMTVVFGLEGVNIDDTVKEVQALLGPQGKATGLKATSSIIATDIGGNLRRVDKLLQQISAAPESTVFKSYPLKYIGADEAQVSVSALMGLQVGVSNISAGVSGDRGGFDPRDPRSWDRSRSESSSSRSSSTTTSTAQARLYAEPRTNSLMATATPAQHRIIEAALQVIDIDEQASGSFARGRKPYLQVYEVSDSDPQEVVKTLSVIIPGVVVNEDGRNEKIHIMATEAQHREVAALIRQLDGMGGGEEMSVIPLVKMDPITAAATLRSMFVRDGTDAPTIEPDLYGRQLMIRGNAGQVAQAKLLLMQLGEDGTGQRRAGEGLLSTFPLSGRDPAEILPLLERAWQGSSPNPVRIIRPSERGPVQDVRTPGGGSAAPGVDVGTELNGPSARLSPRRSRSGVPAQFAAQTEVTPPSTDAAPAAQPARPISDAELDRFLDLIDPPQAAPANPAPAPAAPAVNAAPQPIVVPAAPQPKPAADPNAPVTITVLGDDLVISAADPEVRARMEELIEQVMNSVPPRTTWTIFPLEHSDVTTTAAMLNQLFPESTVVSADSVSGGGGLFGSLSSGISSMSSSLAGMSGLTSSSTAGALRIIPYSTDNALFISGPEYKIREVEEMLRILDSGELSASLRERTPRMIPVRYAEIDDVYTMVKEVYKDALETEQDRGARNAANMFSQMMGGSRRGGESGGSTPVVPLSLGVDRQTSQLIVSSSEAKFQEIKSMVEQIDRSALEAKRTVKVVTLQNTSTSQLKNTVSTLMPRVVISSTGSRSSTPSSSSSSSSSNGSSNGGGESRGPDPEQFRRMMEERMRSMQGSSGGGGDSGRPSFSGSPFGSSGGRPSFGGGGGPFGGGGGSPFGGRGGR